MSTEFEKERRDFWKATYIEGLRLLPTGQGRITHTIIKNIACVALHDFDEKFRKNEQCQDKGKNEKNFRKNQRK
jgi:hypothetical protein